MTGAAAERLPYAPPPELRGGGRRRKVAIVGAGPVGLAAAIDLALHGVPSVLLDDNDRVSVGSRAICWARRSLEILDRLGVGERAMAKGVGWKVGRVYHGDRELYSFDLAPEGGAKAPAFVNLQQYHLERYLIERCRDFPDLIELRFLNRVTGLEQGKEGATLTVETPDGRYALEAEWALACDGARSPLRALLGLDFEGRAFEDRFLIADIRMRADFPAERRFWFEPSFHEGQTALLHRQPDDLWRIDLQLGPEADAEAETDPARVAPRLARAVDGRPFALDWISLYSFQCRRLARFVHGRVIFLGDSAHVVSPFGARGGNGGLQDVDNLCWKLALLLRGEAGPGLLASYEAERGRAADENILHASRATAFMSPRDPGERMLRDETLALAARHQFARAMVNSGRLSTPCRLDGLALQSPDDPAFEGQGAAPGAPCPDAPVAGAEGAGWLLNRLGGRFVLLGVGLDPPAAAGLARVAVGPGGLEDVEGLAAARYGRGVFLIRPDQHVAARWKAAPTPEAIAAALARARGCA